MTVRAQLGLAPPKARGTLQDLKGTSELLAIFMNLNGHSHHRQSSDQLPLLQLQIKVTLKKRQYLLFAVAQKNVLFS